MTGRDRHLAGVAEQFLLLPALAVPLRTKATFVCPPDHIEKLRSELSKVDRIVSVGWKAGEPHFLDLLGVIEGPARLIVVNRSAES